VFTWPLISTVVLERMNFSKPQAITCTISDNISQMVQDRDNITADH